MKSALTTAIISVVFSSAAYATKPLIGMIDIHAGPTHACAVTPQHTVKCWGGRGSNDDPNNPIAVDIAGLTGVQSLSVGDSFACAIIANGNVKCWGDTLVGQLGMNGDPYMGQYVKTPVYLDIGDFTPISGVKAVSSGLNQSCLITAQNTVMCWGDSQPEPYVVPGLTGIQALAVGNDSCALTNQNTVKCWGEDYGRIPVDMKLSNVKAISMNNDENYTDACALTKQGTIECWGDNTYGQLGNYKGTYSSTPVQIPNLTGVKAVSVGYAHTCVITPQDTVKCWGLNNNGDLGDGTTNSSWRPVDVVGISHVQAISTAYQSCALVNGGAVKCWGTNGLGGLGNGTYDNSSVPVNVLTQ